MARTHIHMDIHMTVISASIYFAAARRGEAEGGDAGVGDGGHLVWFVFFKSKVVVEGGCVWPYTNVRVYTRTHTESVNRNRSCIHMYTTAENIRPCIHIHMCTHTQNPTCLDAHIITIPHTYNTYIICPQTPPHTYKHIYTYIHIHKHPQNSTYVP